MIKVTTTRVERGWPGDAYTYPPLTRTLEEAVVSMLKYELGFGGFVKDFSKRSLVIQTEVMNKIDRVVYESDDEEEMYTLFAAAFEWEEARKKVDKNAMADDVLKITGGRPLFVTMVAPFVEAEHIVEKIKEKAEKMERPS